MMLKRALSAVLFFISIGFAPTAIAGHDAGNGGHSVTCYDPAGKLLSVQFFDLWYAKKEPRFKLIDSKQDAKALAKEIVKRLYEIDRENFTELLASYANVVAAQVTLDDDIQLIPPHTFLGNIVPTAESGCRIEPLAVYADTGALLTRGKLWEQLQKPNNPIPGNIQTAAFYVHESIGDMLRQKELSKLPAGSSLDEEMRKKIAKDTVSTTALAFTKLTDKQLRYRLERYRQTGRLFEKPRVGRIETWHKIIGSSTDTLEAAYGDAMKNCEQWKADELKRLEPISEFVLIECTKEGSSEMGKSFPGKTRYEARAIAHITTVPKQFVMRFADGIRSDFIPFYPKYPDLSLPYANLSLAIKWDEWDTNTRKRFGNHIYLHHEGLRDNKFVERPWRWHFISGNDTQSGIVGFDVRPDVWWGHTEYDYVSVGNFAYSTGEVYLYVDSPDITTYEVPLSGEWFSFQGPYETPSEREALKKALESYEAVCSSWLDRQYKNGAVFASCTGDTPASVHVENSPKVSRYRFTSTGKTYYCKD